MSRLSERGWLCVSGSREERDKGKMAERQLRKLARKVRLWLMRVSDKTAPATQARDNSPSYSDPSPWKERSELAWGALGA